MKPFISLGKFSYGTGPIAFQGYKKMRNLAIIEGTLVEGDVMSVTNNAPTSTIHEKVNEDGRKIKRTYADVVRKEQRV